MSSRYHSYDKGSSRSTRDDSRTSKDKHVARRDRRGTKSRSRSPRRQASPSSSREARYSPERSRSPRHRQKSPSSSRESKYSEKSPKSQEKDFEEVGTESPPGWEEKESDEDVPAPPPPPRISKISIGFTKPKAPIKMSLTGPSKSNTIMPKPTVAAVFAEDDDEPEEMPAEAKMRMRNIGRETPTSTGPNSFGKTKQGFCDAKKVFEKNLKQALETADKPASSKFPQTIYKIKGP